MISGDEKSNQICGKSISAERREPPNRRVPGEVPTSGTPIFQRPWMRERAQLLHKLFVRVERRRKQGWSLNKALVAFARYWDGRSYRADSRIRVRLALSTLRVLFYEWVQGGRTEEALCLHFHGHFIPIEPAVLRAFINACTAPGMAGFQSAGRMAGLRGRSVDRVVRMLPAKLRTAIKASFSARRQAEREARADVGRLQAANRRRVREDDARVRRILNLATCKPLPAGGGSI